jgi:hypothetical protein
LAQAQSKKHELRHTKIKNLRYPEGRLPNCLEEEYLSFKNPLLPSLKNTKERSTDIGGKIKELKKSSE